MRESAVLQDVVGLGCGAALPTMRTAHDFLTANPDATVAVIAVEVCSAAFYLDDDPGVVISLCLFGDGASAMVLRQSETPGGGFVAAELHSDGRAFEHLFVPGVGFRRIPYVTQEALRADDHIPQMQGPSLLKKAVRTLSRTVRSICETQGISQNEIDCFIAHQANDRINRAVRDALKIPPEKIPSNIARFGNTSAATIPVAMSEALEAGRIKPGDRILLAAFGAGP